MRKGVNYVDFYPGSTVFVHISRAAPEPVTFAPRGALAFFTTGTVLAPSVRKALYFISADYPSWPKVAHHHYRPSCTHRAYSHPSTESPQEAAVVVLVGRPTGRMMSVKSMPAVSSTREEGKKRKEESTLRWGFARFLRLVFAWVGYMYTERLGPPLQADVHTSGTAIDQVSPFFRLWATTESFGLGIWQAQVSPQGGAAGKRQLQ